MYPFGSIICFAIERLQVSVFLMRIKTVGEIGMLIRDERKRRGWSQTDLAFKAGVSRLWVSRMEGGKESLEVGLTVKALKALGLSIQITPTGRDPLRERLRT